VGLLGLVALVEAVGRAALTDAQAQYDVAVCLLALCTTLPLAVLKPLGAAVVVAAASFVSLALFDTLTVAGDSVTLTGGGGLSEPMKLAKPNVYEMVLQLAGERMDYTADLAARTISARGQNLGCKWSAKL
jgi:hypothetical protein